LDDQEAEILNESKGGVEADPALAATQTQKAGHSENISEGGISLTGDLQLLADRKLERGKKLLVEFLLPGEKIPVSAVAVVVWSIQGKGQHGKFTAGLMFTGIDPQDLEKIQHYVEAQAKT
jgi:hypothetical protein